MGIWDFVKAAGRKIGIGSEEEAPAAEDLKKELDKYGLGTDDVKVEVVGDKAVITGNVADQSILEKAIVAVGNTLGISKVESTVEVADAAGAKEPVFHTVKKGDTLWAISAKQYGNGSKYKAIFEANKPMLSHPDKIYPGQVLRIPDLG